MHIHKKATISIHLTNLFMFGVHIKHINASNSSASLKTYFPRYNLYYFLLFFAIVFASAHKHKHKHNCVLHPKMVKKSRDHVFFNFRGRRGRPESSDVAFVHFMTGYPSQVPVPCSRHGNGMPCSAYEVVKCDLKVLSSIDLSPTRMRIAWTALSACK